VHGSLHELQFWFVPRGVQLPLQQAAPEEQQLLPHRECPGLQAKSQTPLTQVGLELAGGIQALPHMPQFIVLALVSVQTPAQSLRPGGQTHVAPTHVFPPVQTLPQLRQLLASVCRFLQTPPQSVRPGGQTQAPPAQIFGGAQILPQTPQFIGSVLASVQAPPQQDCPCGQQIAPQQVSAAVQQ
jgi:hypothetical protein